MAPLLSPHVTSRQVCPSRRPRMLRRTPSRSFFLSVRLNIRSCQWVSSAMWFALPSECGDDAVSHSVYVTRRDAPARASKQEVVDSPDGFVAHDRRRGLDFLRRKRAGRRRLEIDAANLFRPATFTGWRQRAKAALQHAERLFCHQTSGREFHARHADEALRPPLAPMIPDQGPRRQTLGPVLGCGQKTSE